MTTGISLEISTSPVLTGEILILEKRSVLRLKAVFASFTIEAVLIIVISVGGWIQGTSDACLSHEHPGRLLCSFLLGTSP